MLNKPSIFCYNHVILIMQNNTYIFIIYKLIFLYKYQSKIILFFILIIIVIDFNKFLVHICFLVPCVAIEHILLGYGTPIHDTLISSPKMCTFMLSYFLRCILRYFLHL